MLSRLSIRDIVLIDQLDLDFSRGLTILTGETGAGKSILLDSLSLALGARGDGARFANCAGWRCAFSSREICEPVSREEA